MTTLDVDGFRYQFPDDWRAIKFDDSLFYRDDFSRWGNGVKAVDVVAVEPDGVVWLIEVKDYAVHDRSRDGRLDEEFIAKVKWTLAAMTPARWLATQEDERALAEQATMAPRVRLALHLELRDAHPRNPHHPNNIYDKLRQSEMVRRLDPEPLVLSLRTMDVAPWRVARAPTSPS